jgi:hypothetical protein
MQVSPCAGNQILYMEEQSVCLSRTNITSFLCCPWLAGDAAESVKKKLAGASWELTSVEQWEGLIENRAG